MIVKTIAAPGRAGLPRQVAVMRKLSGKWRWAEYALWQLSLHEARPAGSVCTGCHVRRPVERLGVHEELTATRPAREA